MPLLSIVLLPGFLPVAFAAVPLSPAPSYLALLSFAHSSVLSFHLFDSARTRGGGGGGGVGSGTVTVLPENRGWSVFVRGLLHDFSSCCRFWLFFSASACFSAGSPFPLLWVGGSRVVLYSSCFLGLFLPPVPRPSCLLFFSASGPPLLSCALSESSRLYCFSLSSWPLRGSVTCF